MKVVGCIPAKGSSTRVPSKNLQEIQGVPLFLWAANNLNRVLPKDDIYVDSESDEILEIARKYGFGTIKRPMSLATNATDGNELMLWQASQVEADVYVQHLPTMVFLKKNTLEEFIKKVVNEGYDSSFGVIKDHLYLWENNNPKYDLKNIPNSFNLQATIIETMGIYVSTKESLFNTKLRIGKNFSMVEVDKFEAIDINYPSDINYVKTIVNSFEFDSDYIIGIDTFYKEDKIKFIVLDVDGVMTDGGMYYSESGDEFKKFNTKDGMAIKKALKAGYKIGFLSSSINEKLIKKRAKTLGVEYVYTGRDKKIEVLKNWKESLGISYDEIAYIGDDINDKEVILKVGLSACPNDAVIEIKKLVNFKLSKNGGAGCVREFFDRFVRQRKG